MGHSIINRTEMLDATLDLGGAPIELADYATTGLMAMAVAPRGCGKTNLGCLMAEQLSEQGWISVIVEPEAELESLYGPAVADPEALRERLTLRDTKIIIVSAKDATEFVPYGEVIKEVADKERKPMFVVIDEAQLFSASRKRADGVGEACDLIADFAERGRKRALDLFVTSLRYVGALNRTLFANQNLTLVGPLMDAAAWSGVAQLFRPSGIGFSDLNALEPCEFMRLSRRGVEKVRPPLAKALQGVVPHASRKKRNLPASFAQWDRAMGRMPTERLEALTGPVIDLLSAVAGLSSQQKLAGVRALNDELEARRA